MTDEHRIATLEEEVRMLRQSSYNHSNKLAMQNGQLGELREDVREIRSDMKEGFAIVNKRFNDLAGQAWRVAMFVVMAMGVAVSIVTVIVNG